MTPRQSLLILALAATLAAVWWVESRQAEEGEAPGGVAVRPVAARPAAPAPGAVDVAQAPSGAAAGRRFQAKGPDLFPGQSWQPPPPPPPKPPPPPPPVVPPVPFAYLGRWQEGGAEVLFLAQGQQVHNVRKGDVVGPWRLDEIAAGRLTFTYVPMNKQQTLRFAP